MDTDVKDADSPDGPSKSTARRQRRHGLRTLAVLLPVVLGIAFLLTHRLTTHARHQSPTAPPPLLIGAELVRKGDLGVYLSALGVVTPLNTVAVRSRVDGQ